MTPLSNCCPDLEVGARYRLTLFTVPATASVYRLTHLPLAENRPDEAPTFVWPNVDVWAVAASAARVPGAASVPRDDNVSPAKRAARRSLVGARFCGQAR